MDKLGLDYLLTNEMNVSTSELREKVLNYILQFNTVEEIINAIKPIQEKLNIKEKYLISTILTFDNTLAYLKTSKNRVESADKVIKQVVDNIIEEKQKKIIEEREKQEALRIEEEKRREFVLIEEEESEGGLFDFLAQPIEDTTQNMTNEDCVLDDQEMFVYTDPDLDEIGEDFSEILDKVEDITVDMGEIDCKQITIPIGEYNFNLNLIDNEDEKTMDILDTEPHDIFFLWVYPDMKPVKNLPMLMKFTKEYGVKDVKIPLNYKEPEYIEYKLLKNLLIMNTKVV